MADDTELLNQLEKALRAGGVEPPPARVNAVRRLVTRPRPVLRSVSETDHLSTDDRFTDDSHPMPTPRWGWADRRVTMAFSGAAAAALIVIALIAAFQAVPESTGKGSSTVLRAQNAAYRVQVAIDRRDPGEVAKADADLLRTAETVSGGERNEVQRITVPVHVQAVAFLRDHAPPNVLSDVPGAVSSAKPLGSGAPSDAASSPLPSLPPASLPGGVATPVGPVVVAPGLDAPTTTLVRPSVAPTINITGINPRLDGNFEVNFTIAGFIPDSSGAPGTYTLRLSYDGGADATRYTGDSPWVLPLVKAIVHRQVCADVLDAAGDVVPGSGNCTNIINF